MLSHNSRSNSVVPLGGFRLGYFRDGKYGMSKEFWPTGPGSYDFCHGLDLAAKTGARCCQVWARLQTTRMTCRGLDSRCAAAAVGVTPETNRRTRKTQPRQHWIRTEHQR